MHQHSETTDNGLVRIGNGVGPLGRWFRLFVGLNAALYISLSPLLVNPMPKEELLPYFGGVGMWFLIIFAAYQAVFYFFGKFFFVRLSPWAGTAIFLGIPTLLRVMEWVPMEFRIAFGFYVGISLVATFFMRYGGCEVVAFPSIFFKQRYTMYCPYNAVDAIERAVTIDKFSPAHKALAIVSLGITTFVGGYMIMVEMHSFFGRWGLGFSLPPEIISALLIPILHLSYLTFAAYRKEKKFLAPSVRKFGLGLAILALLTASWVSETVGNLPLWRIVLLVGSIYFGYELLMVAFKKKKLNPAK